MGDKLRLSDLLVGLASIALLISTFLSWFALPSARELVKTVPGAHLVGSGSDTDIAMNVWDLPFARWWVYLSILLGIWMVLAALFSRSPNWATILGTPLVFSSFIALLCLFVRLFDAPRAYTTGQFGLYLAFASTAVLFGAAFWGLRDETVPDGFDRAPRPQFIEVD
jgi:hypothetical protein